MRLTIEVTEGPTDITVGQAGTARPQPPAGDVPVPASIPAGALDAGADTLPASAELTAVAPSQVDTAGEGAPGAPAGVIAALGPNVPAGEIHSAGPGPSAYEGEQQRYSPGIEVDIQPGAGPVFS